MVGSSLAAIRFNIAAAYGNWTLRSVIGVTDEKAAIAADDNRVGARCRKKMWVRREAWYSCALPGPLLTMMCEPRHW